MDIFTAIQTGDFDALNKALSDKQNLTLQNPDYRMEPLHWATVHDQTEMVKLLIDAGALWARRNGQADLVGKIEAYQPVSV